MARTALDLLGVVSPGMAAVAKPSDKNPALTKTLVPGLGLGILGAVTIKKHPLLAFLGGESLGQNAYRMYRNEGADRTLALSNMGVAASGIVGSLAWKKHPFAGFCVGFVAGSFVTSFIPGSNAHKYRHKGEK